jgi:hypothetical protein
LLCENMSHPVPEKDFDGQAVRPLEVLERIEE